MDYLDRVRNFISKMSEKILSLFRRKNRHPNTAQFPVFEIASNPEIRLSEVRARRFYIIDRAQAQAIDEIQSEEDRNIFRDISSLSSIPPGLFSGVTPLGTVFGRGPLPMVGFKPSKENTFKNSKKENKFQIYGVKMK